MCSVATHTRKWIQRTPFQGFKIFSFNLSSRIGPKKSINTNFFGLKFELVPWFSTCSRLKHKNTNSNTCILIALTLIKKTILILIVDLLEKKSCYLQNNAKLVSWKPFSERAIKNWWNHDQCTRSIQKWYSYVTQLISTLDKFTGYLKLKEQINSRAYPKFRLVGLFNLTSHSNWHGNVIFLI